MRKFATLSVLLLLVAFLLTACGPDGVDLKYIYKVGDQHTYKVTVDMDGTMSAPGEVAIPFKGQMSYKMIQKVLEKKDGVYTIETSLAEPTMTINGESLPLTEMADLKATIQMDEKGNIKKINFPGLDIETPIDLESLINQIQAAFPTTPLKVGDTWINKLKVPLPGQDKPVEADVKITYVADEKVGGIAAAKLASTATVNLDMNLDIEGEQVKTTGKEDVAGTMLIDKKTGLPLRADMTIDLTMNQEMDIEGEKVNMQATFKIAIKMEKE